MKEPIDFCKKVAQISTDFELDNSELKKQYIVSNIILYNAIALTLDESRGTFGTGYPFYVLDKKFQGSLPIIQEQFRYNDELAHFADSSSLDEWLCADCLEKNGILMPDLKTICKICPDMDKELKPRKLINRLPDLDLWMLCEPEEMDQAKDNLAKGLAYYGLKTSDVDPVATIYELAEIVEDLKNGDFPRKKIPIDTHIIDTVSLYSLISQIPETLHNCSLTGEVPDLPINPLSLRKKWQHDDNPYNFVHDYLSSFTEFNIDKKIKDILDETRREIAKKYSLDTLYSFLIASGPDCVARRHQTPALKKSFEKRIESWKEL